MSNDLVGPLVEITWGALLVFVFNAARNGSSYVNKTADALVRARLTNADRERTSKRLRWMLVVGMVFGVLFAMVGVYSLIMAMRR
jgi:hypothetical protein